MIVGTTGHHVAKTNGATLRHNSLLRGFGPQEMATSKSPTGGVVTNYTLGNGASRARGTNF